MPDVDSLVVRQVELALHRQEAVDAALVGELGGVVLDVHGGRRGSTRLFLHAFHKCVSFVIIETSLLESLRITMRAYRNSIQ